MKSDRMAATARSFGNGRWWVSDVITILQRYCNDEDGKNYESKGDVDNTIINTLSKTDIAIY